MFYNHYCELLTHTHNRRESHNKLTGDTHLYQSSLLVYNLHVSTCYDKHHRVSETQCHWSTLVQYKPYNGAYGTVSGRNQILLSYFLLSAILYTYRRARVLKL